MSEQPQKSENGRADDESQRQEEFVVDVDPDMNHWQTKETEFFTIKFPKEWYWLESDPTKHGYPSDSGRSRIITNNPNFNIDRYADISIFTGGEYLLTSTSEGIKSMSLPLNDTEIVITNKGWSTGDAGNPEESIKSVVRGLTELRKNIDKSATCERLSRPGIVPATAYCSFSDVNGQKVQTYYASYHLTTFAFTARTAEGNVSTVENIKTILEKITKSLTVKDPSFN